MVVAVSSPSTSSGSDPPVVLIFLPADSECTYGVEDGPKARCGSCKKIGSLDCTWLVLSPGINTFEGTGERIGKRVGVFSPEGSDWSNDEYGWGWFWGYSSLSAAVSLSFSDSLALSWVSSGIAGGSCSSRTHTSSPSSPIPD